MMTNPDTFNTSGTTIKDAGTTAKTAAADMADSLSSSAREAVGKATAEMSDVADSAKSTLADEADSVASALRKAADDLRSGSPQERTFSQMADGLADMSDAVRNKDLGEIVGSLGDFARKNPLVFLGGAALLGFAATRFAKASGSDSAGGQASSATSHPAPAIIGSRPAQSPAHSIEGVTP